MSTEPTQFDPKIVRKVARSAMTLAAQRRDDMDHAILRHGNLGDCPEGGDELREYRTAYGALFAAVRAEMHTATVTVSWPDEDAFPAALNEGEV